MAITQITVSLVAAHSDDRPVSAQDFVVPLAPQPSDPIVRVVADRGAGLSASIRFFQVDITAHRNAPEPYVAFEAEVESGFSRVASWLGTRTDVLRAMPSNGLNLHLLIDMQIDQDQMDLALPASLSSACGQAAVLIQFITND